MKLSNDVLAVLARSETKDGILFLPPGQLERPLYEAVNKVLVAAGGKWNRSAKGHVFAGPAVEAIEPVILTGEVTNKKQEFGQFDTPSDIVEMVVRLVCIKPGDLLLEPSAGTGALGKAAVARDASVFYYEIDPKRHADLMLLTGFSPMTPEPSDFLAERPVPNFDLVLMNPPFAKRADVHHVNHAAKFLKPGGRLVAIMSAGVTFRSDQLTTAFREMVDSEGGTINLLPEDSFKASGTSVNTALVEFTATTF